MQYTDISKLDLTAVTMSPIPKKLKDAARLCRCCRFAEAEMLLDTVDGVPHQVAAIQAQLAFFSGDFDKAISLIMDYFPYLCEWYSGNMMQDTVHMLAFSLMHTHSETADTAISCLQRMYDALTEEQRNLRQYRQFTHIPEILQAAEEDLSGLVHQRKCYAPRETPKTTEEIIASYAKYHEKQIQRLKCPITEDTAMAGDLLLLIYDMGTPEEFCRLYEKHCKSSKLYYLSHIRAIRVYQYLGDLPRAEEAALDYVRYGWMPIEHTDVMPLSLLDGYDIFSVLTKESLMQMYSIPKGRDDEMAAELLEYSGNFDDLFRMGNMETIGTVSVTGGKLVTADPLVYLEKDTLPLSQNIPKGEYPLTALTASGNILAVRLEISQNPAVRYVNASDGSLTQAELADGGKYGFPVDSGLITIADSKAVKEFCKFRDTWQKKHKDTDFYRGVLEELFLDAAGDYMDFDIPGMEYHMPIFAGGAGDGYYPAYWGYDAKGKVCSLVIAFMDTD